MTKITRGWTPKRRAKQALNCRNIQPWKHSTGPRTKSGKEAVKYNSVKHGISSVYGKMLLKLLRIQKEFVKQVSKLRKDGYSAESICLIMLNINNLGEQ